MLWSNEVSSPPGPLPARLVSLPLLRVLGRGWGWWLIFEATGLVDDLVGVFYRSQHSLHFSVAILEYFNVSELQASYKHLYGGENQMLLSHKLI